MKEHILSLWDESSNEDLSLLRKELFQVKIQYSELYDFSPVSYFTLNFNKEIVAVNLEGAALLGVSKSFLINKSFLDFVAMHSQPGFNNHINTIFESKEKAHCEIELLVIKKPRIYVRINSLSLSHNLILMCLTDITTIRRHELAIIESNKKLALLEKLFQNTSEAMAALDFDFYFTKLNQAFIRFFSKTFATRVQEGMSLLLIVADFPELKADIISACEKAKLGKKSFITLSNDTDNEETFYYYELLFFSFYDPDTQQACGITIDVHDLSPHKWNQRQQAMQQAVLANETRMNAVGEMAAALAHEINQPLAAINMYSYSCLYIYKNGLLATDKIINGLEKIHSLTLHAGDILHRMKNFIREGELFLEQTDINALIENTLNYLDYKKVELKFQVILNLGERLPLISIDRVKIVQVILNLAQNSIEAASVTQNHLKITIETFKVNHYIEIHIRDNGPGISPELAEKIMHSYFTTKAQGTGLGLPICRTLVEAHGGKLMVNQFDKGKGAWIYFTLPLTEMIPA